MTTTLGIVAAIVFLGWVVVERRRAERRLSRRRAVEAERQERAAASALRPHTGLVEPSPRVPPVSVNGRGKA